MESLIQITGSLLVLVPFILVQMKRLTSSGRLFLSLNVLGSTVLAIDALVTHQWGFLLLEGVWAIVSAIGLVRALRTAASTA